MHLFRKYLFSLLASFVGGTILLASFNLAMDPFNVFGTNWTGEYIGAEREYKNDFVRRFPHDALLLGNSKVGYVDPQQLNGNCRFFNAAFPGAFAEEIYYFLERGLSDERLVVMGLDLEMFNEAMTPLVPKEEFFRSARLGILDNLLGWTVAKASARSLSNWLSGKPPLYRRNGSSDATEAYETDRRMSAAADDPRTINRQLPVIERRLFKSFSYSKARVDYIKKIKDLLDSKRVAAIVFINPLSEHMQRMYDRLGLNKEMDRLRSDLSQIFPAFHDLTKGQYLSPRLYFNFDPIHYKPEIGATFINEMLRQNAAAGSGSMADVCRQR